MCCWWHEGMESSTSKPLQSIMVYEIKITQFVSENIIINLLFVKMTNVWVQRHHISHSIHLWQKKKSYTISKQLRFYWLICFDKRKKFISSPLCVTDEVNLSLSNCGNCIFPLPSINQVKWVTLPAGETHCCWWGLACTLSFLRICHLAETCPSKKCKMFFLRLTYCI